MQAMLLIMAKQLLRKQKDEDDDDEGLGQPRVTGAKGYAARASYQRTMAARPRPFIAAFRRRLAEQMEVQVSQLNGAALRGYFERRSPLGTHKLLTYNAFAVAKTWEHIEHFTTVLEAQPAAVRDALRPSLDQIATMVMSHATFIDQTAIDGGKYNLSWLLTGLAGYMLTAIDLRSDETLKISSDELREFYYTFIVTEKRAQANAIGLPLHSSSVAHLSAYTGEFDGEWLLPCLATLAMGDSLSPEIAQSAHFQLLRQRCGAMLSANVVASKRRIPRGPLYEMLTYDDHAALFRVSSTTRRRPDLELFVRCDATYPSVGLTQHPKKRVRDADRGIVLGAEVRGIEGLVHPPALRLAFMIRLTIEFVRVGHSDYHTLAAVVGSWISMGMFRRPLLCNFQHVFTTINILQRSGGIVTLTNVVRNELLSMAVCSLLCVTDLRVQYCDHVIGVDASPSACGLVRARIGQFASRELWRMAEHRGFYTHLLPPSAESLRSR
eukprot:5957986-Amphidinium_carterae.1